MAKVFLLFLVVLGGFMAGAARTQKRMLSGNPDVPIANAQTTLLTSDLALLSRETSTLMKAAFGSFTNALPNTQVATPSSVPAASITPLGDVSPLPSGVDPLTAIPVPAKDDHYRGNLDAKIVLVEYGDFECPYCAQFEPTMNQLTQEYGDKIGRVWRHFPLAIHPHAESAAEASECVAKQLGNDGFWKFNDSIFAQNTALGGSITPEAITKAASDAGADMTAFQTCLSSGEMVPVVQANQLEGLKAGFAGTPSTVMIMGDGQHFLLSGAVTFDDMKKFIDSYL